MELVVEPDIYSPSVDELGNYIDKVPAFSLIKKGLMCPCGSRKDKVYDTSAKFTVHIKSQTHQKWLTTLNTNKVNYYSENLKLLETIKNQRLIIAKLEKDVSNKNLTIDYLTQQLHNNNIKTGQVNKNVPVGDLLDFN